MKDNINNPKQLNLNSYLYEIITQNAKNETNNVLSLPPVLTILTLPYREVKNSAGKKAIFYEKSVVRNKTTYSLSIKTGLKRELDKDNNYEIYGIPYGAYARLLLYYICSEVIKTKDKTIILGSSYNEIFKNLKISETSNNINGRQINSLKEQIDRLINATIIFSSTKIKQSETNPKKQDTEVDAEFMQLVKGIKQIEFWDKDTKKQNFGYQIKITDDFFNMITKNKNVVFDYNIIPKIKDSQLALDLALHLNHWAYNATFVARKDLAISYDILFEQFGSQSNKKEFKRMLKQALKKVTEAVPSLRVYSQKTGILVEKGSLPSVAVDSKSIKRLEENAKIDILELEQQSKNNEIV